MKKIIPSLLIAIMANVSFIGFSQMIEPDPVYPSLGSAVDIIFYADQCDCGLNDFTGDIYAHTGVLTDESNDKGDWKFVIAEWSENLEKAKLEKIADNTYVLHITPSIKEYYNIPDGTQVEELAFVFRNSTGASQTTNQYQPVYETGLSVVISEPSDDLCVVSGTSVAFAAEAVVLNTTTPDSLSLYIDDSLEYISYGDTLGYEHNFNLAGNHWVKVIASNNEFSASDSVRVFVTEGVMVENLPEGVRDGANIINDSTVTLVIYAPEKECILAIGDFNNWELSNDYLMKQTPDGNRFWITLDSIEAGLEYAFQYLIDGNLRIADPYTEKILDPTNDPYISSSTYPDLKPYPSGKTNGLVSVFQTAQEEYIWQHTDFEPPQKTDLVIYELWVYNYTDAHNIKALTDTLDYLEELGVNAIELMPVNEFEGNISWGYNPSFYFAFDKAYGTKNDFKAFVDACHARGIAVIIDLVLNHSYSQSPLLQMYWNNTTNKPAANNPWYNGNHNFVDNTSAQWGFDFDHESEATQFLVDSINSYWMSEYKVDGFRFDFTKGMSNTLWYGSDNWASAYDADRVAILKRMADEIWDRNPNAYVSFEHLSDNSEETELANYGIMLWGNGNHDAAEATMGYSSSFNYSSYLTRGWAEPNLVNYMESHDEERLMYKNQRWGASNDSYDTKDLNTALARMETVSAFFFSIPGPKMMFQWGELGYDYSINTCSDGSVDDNGGCRLTPKPIRWDYYNDMNRYRLFKIYQALIKLKIEEELFETNDFELQTSSYMKRLHLNSESMNATVLGNFSLNENTMVPHFQHTGTWYDYITGESIEIVDLEAELSLAAGEYKLYTDVQLAKPDVPVGIDYNWPNQPAGIYPNPTSGQIVLENISSDGDSTFELYSLTGAKVLELPISPVGNSAEIDLEQYNLKDGLYIFRIQNFKSTQQGKLAIKK